MDRNFETYTGWKKDLIKLCKEFDKNYVKHMGSKGCYKEMAEIHESSMKPLKFLIDANVNFHNLELMINAKKEVPEFRRVALEEQFCKHLTGVCEIFKTYGEVKDHFDIKQMLKVLKIEDWQSCTPFWYILTPLNNAITIVRKTLLQQHKLGHLRVKYIVEHNDALQKETIDMIKKDMVS